MFNGNGTELTVCHFARDDKGRQKSHPHLRADKVGQHPDGVGSDLRAQTDPFLKFDNRQ